MNEFVNCFGFDGVTSSSEVGCCNDIECIYCTLRRYDFYINDVMAASCCNVIVLTECLASLFHSTILI